MGSNLFFLFGVVEEGEEDIFLSDPNTPFVSCLQLIHACGPQKKGNIFVLNTIAIVHISEIFWKAFLHLLMWCTLKISVKLID